MRVREILPYLIVLCGVLSDYVTTIIGLSMPHIYETHPEANPLIALAIFFAVITVLKLTMPEGGWRKAPYIFAAVSFLGAINNILVILGIFPGLVIPNILKLLIG
ncbi:MAG: hypothetical protein QXT16_08150 [Candidatus Caldarchaeum sp.]